ncbi:hypothetical protein TELCIR_22452 [Teladorsagia circumcincta]|uniref:Phytanoyl-CoA dioxygenase n=1 Tax=Teladorsagia circumcincta TaxID=45464 RepID=A0A2G9TDW7_TELCI|nr:hypothetical protein TELCIR_22452 [Teladorsagia circumcincta]
MATLGQGVLQWDADGTVLSKEQKQFYEKNGYLLIRNCVPSYELERYKRRFKVILKPNITPT